MSQPIHFTKMHGLGNDFVVINALNQKVSHDPLFITQLADRHQGIGFDQMLLIEPSKRADFFCRIFNSDGSEAEQCGNGLRCVAKFVYEEGLYSDTELTIETKAGVFPISIQPDGLIKVTLHAPHIKEKLLEIALLEDNEKTPISILALGNPHAIIKVDNVNFSRISSIADRMAKHQLFPEGVNVGFLQVKNNHHVRLRTFERGAGETNACGSNACAAACIGIVNHWVESPVRVEFKYGSLEVEWAGNDESLTLTGPAVKVFTGSFVY